MRAQDVSAWRLARPRYAKENARWHRWLKTGKPAFNRPGPDTDTGGYTRHDMAKDKKTAFVWLVRHGEAAGNRRHELNGSRIDAPLTENGTRQANALAKSFPFKPDVLLSSPLTRAVATARGLAKRWGMPLHLTKMAEEQDYGDFSGKTITELAADPRYRSCFHRGKFDDQIYTLRCPHGESWARLKKRAARFLAWLDRRYAGQRVAVVSHSDFINCAYGVRFGLSDEQVFRRRDIRNGGWVRL